MKRIHIFSLIASSLALLSAGSALADLRVGVNLGAPPVYVAPQPVYAPPPVVYAPPPRPVLVIGWYGDRYWDGRRYWARNEWYRRHPHWDRDHRGHDRRDGGPNWRQ